MCTSTSMRDFSESGGPRRGLRSPSALRGVMTQGVSGLGTREQVPELLPSRRRVT